MYLFQISNRYSHLHRYTVRHPFVQLALSFVQPLILSLASLTVSSQSICTSTGRRVRHCALKVTEAVKVQKMSSDRYWFGDIGTDTVTGMVKGAVTGCGDVDVAGEGADTGHWFRSQLL